MDFFQTLILVTYQCHYHFVSIHQIILLTSQSALFAKYISVAQLVLAKSVAAKDCEDCYNSGRYSKQAIENSR